MTATMTATVNVEANLLRIDIDQLGFQVEMVAKVLQRMNNGAESCDDLDEFKAGVQICIHELEQVAERAQAPDDAAELAQGKIP